MQEGCTSLAAGKKGTTISDAPNVLLNLSEAAERDG